MTNGMLTVKMTNKNRGINIEEAKINCQNPQVLIKMTRAPFTTPYRLFVT